MPCYAPRYSINIGEIFISANGSCRVIPDQWLHEAMLEGGSNVLRLCYSSCMMEIRGGRLDKVFEDASLGKLGTVEVSVPTDDVKAADAMNSPFVTSIIHVPMSLLAVSDLERSEDA